MLQSVNGIACLTSVDMNVYKCSKSEAKFINFCWGYMELNGNWSLIIVWNENKGLTLLKTINVEAISTILNDLNQIFENVGPCSCCFVK